MAKFIQLVAALPGSADRFERAYLEKPLSTLRNEPGVTEAIANFVIPGSTVGGGHIADTPPPPSYDLLNWCCQKDVARRARGR